MSKGIFTAVSGAVAQTAQLDTIANNIANVNTPAFKKDSQIFREYLSAYEKEPNVIPVPRIPASIESFYDMQGGDKSYVDIKGTHTDFTQGSVKQTGNKLDIAIEGEGFLEVLTPEGLRWTRDGALKVDAEGRLVTKQGFLVMKDGGQGQDPATRAIKVNSANLTFSSNGEIFDGAENLGKLAVVQFGNKDSLMKTGLSMFGLRDNQEPEMTVAQEFQIHQGAIESSNVNAIQEMTNMISTSRVFESTQKAIQAYDQMAAKLVHDVPRLKG